MSDYDVMNCPEHGEYKVLRDAVDKSCPVCKKRKSLKTFLKTLPPAYLEASLDNYITTTSDQKGTLEFCQAFVEKLIERHNNQLPLRIGLVFFGRTGTGKTHLALGILKLLAEEGITVEYITCTDLLKLDGPMNVNPAVEKDRTRLKKVQVLVIDDLVKMNLPSNRELLFNIIDTRYQHLACTILITNVYERNFKQHDERVISRMQERAYFLPFMWEDYRSTAKRLSAKEC